MYKRQVIDVPLEEASRFGILNTHEDGEIYEFDEKPEKPKSTHASMGIYIFSYKELRKYLIEDDENKNSSHDFGDVYKRQILYHKNTH